MSFSDLITLFLNRRVLFLGTLATVTLTALAFFHFQPERYESEVVLSVTRTATAPTAEYAYDHFYRFQADERLAESLAQYLGTLAGRSLVAERSGLGAAEYDRVVATPLQATRVGTNLVIISETVSDRAAALARGDAILVVANTYVASLNEDARETTWFTVLSDGPVIRSAQFGLGELALIGFLGGAFAGFWVVLAHWFWHGYRKYHRQPIPKNQ